MASASVRARPASKRTCILSFELRVLPKRRARTSPPSTEPSTICNSVSIRLVIVSQLPPLGQARPAMRRSQGLGRVGGTRTGAILRHASGRTVTGQLAGHRYGLVDRARSLRPQPDCRLGSSRPEFEKRLGLSPFTEACESSSAQPTVALRCRSDHIGRQTRQGLDGLDPSGCGCALECGADGNPCDCDSVATVLGARNRDCPCYRGLVRPRGNACPNPLRRKMNRSLRGDPARGRTAKSARDASFRAASRWSPLWDMR